MTREQKTLAVTCLTVFLYTLAGFFQSGKFIFPFPIYEAIFLLVVIHFTILHWRKYSKINFIIYLLIGIFQLLSNEFYWNFIFNTKEMLWFSQQIFTDVSHILCYLLILFEFTRFFVLSKWKPNILFYFLMISLLISGLIMNQLLFKSLAILCFAILLSAMERRKSITYYFPAAYLWYLLFFLDLTEWIMLFLM